MLQLLTGNGQQSQVNMVRSSFNAADFKKHGVEDIVRGMFVTGALRCAECQLGSMLMSAACSDIPHFHSGVQNSYRNIKHMD